MITVRSEASRPEHPEAAAVWDIAAAVTDPEIPVLTIADLGILRRAAVTDGPQGPAARVWITPTYSGCPAVDAMSADIAAALRAGGYTDVRVDVVLAPAWTTDWMTERGKARLREYGIAPPAGKAASGPVRVALAVRCPQCSSLDTRELSRFGSTSCKSLYVCRTCLEPFDYFKVL